MSGDKVSGFTAGGVPIGIVKGGTTSSRYDNHVAKEEEAARGRRAVQDAMYAKRAEKRKPGELVRLGSMNFVNQTTPRLVLSYLNKDKTVRQQAISEITMIPIEGRSGEVEMTFTMVCPRCVARGVPQGQSQMHVRESHRKFWLDERQKGVVKVEFGWGEKQIVMIAGTVTCQDKIRCDNTNCDYVVRIDHSNVIEE